jgi:hypothetical protein
MRAVLVTVAVVALAALAAGAMPASAVVRCRAISVPQVYRVRIVKALRRAEPRGAC